MIEAPLIQIDQSLVCSFDLLPDDASHVAGGKASTLSRLARMGFPVPAGFVICTRAFQSFLEAQQGEAFIRQKMAELEPGRAESVADAATAIREFILARPLPSAVELAVREAYSALARPLVAVRSSAIGEDGDGASFAGQHDTFLGVLGADVVVDRVRQCWASFFTARALFYRRHKGDLGDPSVAVIVQEMVIADASGVLFTVDPVRKRREHMVIEAVLGLGEGIVSGLITPDHYVVDRSSGTIVREMVGVKDIAIVYDPLTKGTTERRIPEAEGTAPAIARTDLERLREMGLRLERSLGGPQDIEWSIQRGELRILQSRPITTM